MKNFIEMCKELINANIDIKFQGQFIALGDNHMSDNHYKLMHDAGLSKVFIGLESGSEEIRRKMRKKFSNKHFHECITHLTDYSIQMIWFLIIGYPDETEELFEETISLLEKYSYLNTDSYSIEITVCEFEPYEAWTNRFPDRIYATDDGSWADKINPQLTKNERLRRFARLRQVLKHNGYIDRDICDFDNERN